MVRLRPPFDSRGNDMLYEVLRSLDNLPNSRMNESGYFRSLKSSSQSRVICCLDAPFVAIPRIRNRVLQCRADGLEFLE